VAESVIAIDISNDAIIYAQNNYKSSNAKFLKIDDGKLPFENNTFDLITSFQVIEHFHDTKQYLSEINRVLKPGGYFLLTTPDRATRLFPFQKPWNYYHIIEYSPQTLKNKLSKYFTDIRILKIGGDKELVHQELKRRKFTKLVSLPFTLIIYPDSIRKFFLGILKKIYYSKPQILAKDHEILEYNENDIIINQDIIHFTDLMVVCK
jgi:ubiquinone/menaquinone biosynthesis C-methylase UbiE